MTLNQRVKLALALPAIIIFGGTAGYMNIERWTFLDSLYMTVITISTVGFREVGNLSPLGKTFTMGLIISSISMFAYCVAVISRFIMEGHFQEIGRKRKMETKIKKMKNRYIVCGEGKVAEQVVEEFKGAKAPFIIITRDFETFGKNLELASSKTDADLLYIHRR